MTSLPLKYSYFNKIMMIIFIFCFAPFNARGQDQASLSLQISGAGPSTSAVALLAENFTKAHPEIFISVPSKSIKHKGGLEWVTTHKQLFGRLGRALSQKDLLNYPSAREIPIGKIKIGFAVQKDVALTNLTTTQWKDIYTEKITNWSKLGGPDKRIILLGREDGEASLQTIINDHPFFENISFMKKFKKDHLIINAIGKVPGAIGFASTSGLSTNQDVKLIKIEGFHSGQQIGLVYNTVNEGTEIVHLMKTFIDSEVWRKTLVDNGFIPMDRY